MLQQQTHFHHAYWTRMDHSAGGDRRFNMLDEIVLLLGRQFTAYNAACQSALAEKLGIPPSDLKALELIMEFDALPTGHLAQLMGISSGGATALINRLEAGGYVQRGRHPLDRRIIVIRPIEAQCQALARDRQSIAEAIATTARGYDTAELETVHAFLTRCGRGMRRDTLAWLDSDAVHQAE